MDFDCIHMYHIDCMDIENIENIENYIHILKFNIDIIVSKIKLKKNDYSYCMGMNHHIDLFHYHIDHTYLFRRDLYQCHSSLYHKCYKDIRCTSYSMDYMFPNHSTMSLNMDFAFHNSPMSIVVVYEVLDH